MKSKALGFGLFLFFTSNAFAQFTLGSGGSLRGDFGNFPTITTNDWNNNREVPTFDSEVEVPYVPDDLDRGGLRDGSQELPPPGIPTILDMISEGDQEGPAEDPTSLTLPDPDDLEPGQPVYPMPDVLTGVIEAEVLAELGTSPLFSMDQRPSSIKECSRLPLYGAVEFAMDLKNPEMDQEQYLEAHTLWIKTRICKKGGTIGEGNSNLKVLNENDTRCVYYTGQNYKDDISNAETVEDRQVIENLYHQYFFNCF